MRMYVFTAGCYAERRITIIIIIIIRTSFIEMLTERMHQKHDNKQLAQTQDNKHDTCHGIGNSSVCPSVRL